jgi:L-cysteine S-thiosulfotransferase
LPHGLVDPLPDACRVAGDDTMWWSLSVQAIALMLMLSPAMAQQIAPFTVSGDSIEARLEARTGNAARGEAVVKNRETGNCLICHEIPDRRERFQGELGPPLAGVGLRLTAGQIRLRLVDPTRVNPAAVMPAYHRVHGLANVDPRHAGRPVLGAQEIEDVVSYLSGLRE